MTSILDRICLFVGVLLGCAISPTTGPSSDRSRDGREAVQLYSSPHTAPSAGGAVPHPALDSSEAAGRWRRAKRSDLERLMLWPSHLLIRHADVHEADSVSFTMADFHSVLPRPTRTRDEARALARTLVDRARERPARFAELARQYSEDIVRKDSGGSFGGIPAARLTPWPAVLDAVLALSPGEISEPVETWYGFHIFTRRAPPEPQTVTGRRIVIGHEKARWLAMLDASAPPSRPREAAQELAVRVYAAAKAAPTRFSELVARHSELRDRILDGDFGTWSNHEPSPFPVEVEVLGQLEPGEVAPPFDSLFGFQIIQRVPNRERMEYAIEGVRFLFESGVAADDPRSRASVLAVAREVAARAGTAPSLLPELQRQGLPLAAQWTDGRGSPEVSAAVAATRLGEFLAEPVRTAHQYWFGRRVQPAVKVPVEPLFALPATPDTSPNARAERSP
jgi:hypothetical protein